MNVVVLKIILIIVMGVVGFICGTLPIKVYDLLKKRSKDDGYSSLIISLLSCFAGGVILGVCLLDMLPDAQSDLNELKKEAAWNFDYPFLELFIGIGFFFVYFLEEVIDKLCVHGHENTRQRRMTVAVLPPSTIDVMENNTPHHISDVSIISCEDQKNNNINNVDYSSTSSDRPFACRTETLSDEEMENEKHEKRKALVSALTFVLALGVHVFLEGFAFGVQDTQASVTSLFAGIIVHKSLVMFSVGMNLTEKLSDRKWIVIALITVLSVFSPLSATIGLLIQDSDINKVPKAIISTILTCFSIGCFFFISFFDILAVERKNKHNNILQWIACVAGFIATALMVIIAE